MVFAAKKLKPSVANVKQLIGASDITGARQMLRKLRGMDKNDMSLLNLLISAFTKYERELKAADDNLKKVARSAIYKGSAALRIEDAEKELAEVKRILRLLEFTLPSP